MRGICVKMFKFHDVSTMKLTKVEVLDFDIIRISLKHDFPANINYVTLVIRHCDLIASRRSPLDLPRSISVSWVVILK